MGSPGSGTSGRSVTFKYTVFVLLATVCFLSAIYFISFGMMRGFALRTGEETALSVLEGTDTRIGSLFENFESLARSLAGTSSVKNADSEGMRDLFVSTVLGWKRYIRAIYLGTADGVMHEWGLGKGFDDYAAMVPPGYDPRQRPWYRFAMESDAFAVSPPYRYATVDALGITCVLQVRDDSGAFVGVLGIDILLDNLRTILTDLSIPQRGRALILGENGDIIAGHLSPGPGDGLPLARLEAPDLPEHLKKPSGKFQMRVDGEETLFYYRKSTAAGWFILVALPYDSIMLPVRETLSLITLIDILLMGMLTIALGTISNRLISAPLHGIVSVINRIEGGDRSARIAVRSDDEFALLGREFNKLVDAVDGYSASLESKVRERTEELRALQKENTRLRVVEERRRIYRDMHDTLGAKLTNIFFCNNVARSALERNPEKLGELFDDIESNCMEAVRNLKEIVGELKEEDGAGEEFPLALVERVRRRLERNGIALTVRDGTAGAAEALDAEAKAELTKIFDELVSNALKHSGAGKIQLSFNVERGKLKFSFKDDGAGFDRKTVLGTGSGLSNIDFRIGRLGGTISVRSRPGKGAVFTADIPLERSGPEESE